MKQNYSNNEGRKRDSYSGENTGLLQSGKSEVHSPSRDLCVGNFLRIEKCALKKENTYLKMRCVKCTPFPPLVWLIYILGNFSSKCNPLGCCQEDVFRALGHLLISLKWIFIQRWRLSPRVFLPHQKAIHLPEFCISKRFWLLRLRWVFWWRFDALRLV